MKIMPPTTVLSLPDDGIEVLAAGLQVPDGAFDGLWRLLSPAEQARANRFLAERHRREYAVGRGRLRQLLAGRLGADPAAVEIVEGPQGKPELGGRWAGSGLDFNLSHSGGLAVYAFATARELGVDVEALRAVPDALQLATRFFSAAETAAVGAYPPELRERAFLACWTRKEAFVKALGQGLGFPLDRFSVSVDPDTPAEIIEIEGVPGPRTGWSIRAFTPCPTHLAALVYRQRT